VDVIHVKFGIAKCVPLFDLQSIVSLWLRWCFVCW